MSFCSFANMVMSLVVHALHTVPYMLIALGCLIFVVRQPSVFGVMALLAEIAVVLFAIISTVLLGVVMFGHMEPDIYGYCVKVTGWLMLGGNLLFALAFIGLAATCKRRERRRAASNTAGPQT